MTQMSASRTSRIGFPVRVRMPMKIDTCCVIRSVANVTPKMSPRNLLRSPVSILSAIQLIRCPPLFSGRDLPFLVAESKAGAKRGNLRFDFASASVARTCNANQARDAPARGSGCQDRVPAGGHAANGRALPRFAKTQSRDVVRPKRVARCIVPFDGQNRGPAGCGALLKFLGRGVADVRLARARNNLTGEPGPRIAGEKTPTPELCDRGAGFYDRRGTYCDRRP